MEADHGLAEMGRLFGMLPQVIEHGHPPGLLEARLARLQRIDDLLPAPPKRRAAKRQQRGSGRAGSVGLERFAQGGERESLLVSLGKDPETGQRAHEPVERRRVGVRLAGQFDGALGSGRQVIG